MKRRLALYLAVSTAAGLFFCSQALAQKWVSREPTPAWHYVASWLVGMYLWAAFTPGILWLARRWPLERKRWLLRVAQHLPLSAAVSLTQLAVESVILHAIGVFPTLMTTYATTLIFLLIIGFHQGIATYWTVLGIHQGWRYYRRYQERERDALRLETQLVRAQLGALKMQLQPHFLFNTLNAIMVLVRQQKPAEAEEMLARLGDLLRCVLEESEAQEVPLRRELEFVALYLGIEQVRFQDRLKVEVAVDPEVLDAAVPHLGLQPIVENAIRHGIGKSSAAGKLRISACRAGGHLEIEVEDDGPGLEAPNGAAGRGIGLANTRARLKQLYGDAARLTVENGPRGGTLATLVLPYQEIHALEHADRG